jgi:hypothetical protein
MPDQVNGSVVRVDTDEHGQLFGASSFLNFACAYSLELVLEQLWPESGLGCRATERRQGTREPFIDKDKTCPTSAASGGTEGGNDRKAGRPALKLHTKQKFPFTPPPPKQGTPSTQMDLSLILDEGQQRQEGECNSKRA